MAKSSEDSVVKVNNTTVEAFNILKKKEKNGKSMMLGQDETKEKDPNNQVVVYVVTPQDKKTHKYFHSLSIDKQVEDFMGTAELRCPYDSDLMEYWEPIRNYCVIYGSNKGKSNAKILFIGRVRELRQEGYELCIVFQDYGWKFKQNVTQSYANDNVVNKDGYTIMKLMFAALKIDSWVISPSAKYRLKQVGYDKDGNVTLNKKKIESMPDLIDRLKKSDPNKAINNWTAFNKTKESQVHNVKNINYTLKYEKPTPVMKKIASQGKGGFAPGASMYGTNYGSGGAQNGGGAQGGDSSAQGGGQEPPGDLCSYIGSSDIIAAMKDIWRFNRGYRNDYGWAQSVIVNYARNTPATYSSKAVPCLNTLAKYSTRSDGRNAASAIRNYANSIATMSGTSKAIQQGVTSMASGIVSGAQQFINSGAQALGSAYNYVDNASGGWLSKGVDALKSVFWK